jgi:HlyD family secretion protein
MEQNEGKNDIEALIGAAGGNLKAKRTLRSGFWLGLVVFIIFMSLFLFRGSASGNAVSYVTHGVSRDDMTITVTATGKTEPRNEVSVGIEVSGTIAAVYVDHNDVVDKGDLLARLDTTILSAELAHSKASLQLALAAKQEAEATLLQSESDYD